MNKLLTAMYHAAITMAIGIAICAVAVGVTYLLSAIVSLLLTLGIFARIGVFVFSMFLFVTFTFYVGGMVK